MTTNRMVCRRGETSNASDGGQGRKEEEEEKQTNLESFPSPSALANLLALTSRANGQKERESSMCFGSCTPNRGCSTRVYFRRNPIHRPIRSQGGEGEVLRKISPPHLEAGRQSLNNVADADANPMPCAAQQYLPTGGRRNGQETGWRRPHSRRPQK